MGDHHELDLIVDAVGNVVGNVVGRLFVCQCVFALEFDRRVCVVAALVLGVLQLECMFDCLCCFLCCCPCCLCYCPFAVAVAVAVRELDRPPAAGVTHSVGAHPSRV